MSELISGEEAKKAWAEGVDVQVATGPDKFRALVSSDNLGIFDCGNYFRLKPSTATLNGVEISLPESCDWHFSDPSEVILKFKSREEALHFHENIVKIFSAIK